MKLSALLDRANPEAVPVRIGGLARVNGRAAIAAEPVCDLEAALRGLDIDFWLAAYHHERFGRCRYHYAIGRTGRYLAVGAVADHDRIRVNLCLISNFAAMALTVNFHVHPPARLQIVAAGSLLAIYRTPAAITSFSSSRRAHTVASNEDHLIRYGRWSIENDANKWLNVSVAGGPIFILFASKRGQTSPAYFAALSAMSSRLRTCGNI
jgi:hypothetical protein